MKSGVKDARVHRGQGHRSGHSCRYPIQPGQGCCQTRISLPGSRISSLEAQGWWGKRLVTDKTTGEVAETRLASRHMRTIYDNNMRTALRRSSGVSSATRTRPYYLYLWGLPWFTKHVRWAGSPPLTALGRSLPPNGYGCKCHVRAIAVTGISADPRDGVPGTNIRAELDDLDLPGRLIHDTMPAITAVPDQYRSWRSRLLARSGASPLA